PTLTPSPTLFGQQVTADLDIVVNAKVADPASFQARARFLPYTLVTTPRRDVEKDAGVVRVRYRFQLACDSLACTTPPKRERKITFAGAVVHYRDRQGKARTVNATWPVFRLVSRTGDEQFRPQTASEAERGLPTAPLLELPGDASAPPPTYRFSPTTGAIV